MRPPWVQRDVLSAIMSTVPLLSSSTTQSVTEVGRFRISLHGRRGICLYKCPNGDTMRVTYTRVALLRLEGYRGDMYEVKEAQAGLCARQRCEECGAVVVPRPKVWHTSLYR